MIRFLHQLQIRTQVNLQGATSQPQPASDLPASASESASTQQVTDQAASPSVQAAESEPTPTPELPQGIQAPPDESASMSTAPVIEPSGNVPPAQEVPQEIEPIKQENQSIQADTEPQNQSEAKAIPPQNPESSPAPSTPPAPSIPSLHYPFFGSNPVTFDFGAQPSDEAIKRKHQEWDIVGHNGIDFGLQEGTEVLACDEGVVTQAGDNGDHGISVTIKHSWGTSIYSHLQSLGVLMNDQVKKAQVISASGQTGFTTGPHLHFGIQPTNPDTNNGYLGYINPTSYLTETSPLPQSPLPVDLSAEASAKEEASVQDGVLSQPPDLSGDLSEEKLVEETSVAPAKQSEPQLPQSPLSPQSPQHPQVSQSEPSQEDIQKQAVAMFDARIKENSIKGNQAKKAKRDEAIQKIFAFAQEKKRITNEQVRDFLHVSQSTASDYLSDFVQRGMLKVEGKGRATVYVF